MAISDDLNSIRTHLEDDYTALEQLGVSVEDRNIENIKDMANQIYAKFPKTAYSEGSNITLSNTLKGKLDFEDGIVGIGDTEQDTYVGYNLLEPNFESYSSNGVTLTNNNNGTYTLNGTASADTNFVFKRNWTLESNTQYRVSGCPSGGGSDKYFIYGVNFSNFPNETGSGVTATTGTSGVTLAFRVKSGVNVSGLVLKPMVTKGTTQNTFEPYVGGTASPNPSYPQTINSVTGNQDVIIRGINEFKDIETQTINDMKITYTKNGYILNGTTSANTTFRSTISNPKNSNKTLVVKCDTAVTNANIQVKTRNSSASQLRSISLSTANTWEVSSGEYEDYYCDIYIKSGVTLNNVLIQPMLLEGTYTSSDVPDYEPYITPTSYQLSLGEYEFAKIGNYVDTIEYDVENDKVYKNKAINKKVFIGADDEGWVASYNDGQRAYTTQFANLILRPVSNDTPFSGLCDKLVIRALGSLYGGAQSMACSTGGTLSVRIDGVTTINFSSADFKAWLSAHNLITYSALTEAVKEEITGTLKDQIKALYYSHSFTGTTIIEIDGDLPMIIKARALKGESN